MSRRPLEPVEVICQNCGLIAELMRPRGAPRPVLCSCPTPKRVQPMKRKRRCVTCSTVLNRYNPGLQCGPCRKAGREWTPEAE